MATNTWKPPPNGDNPANIDDLRKVLAGLTKKRSGGQALCDDKFIKDHLYLGHTGPTERIALALAIKRGIDLSTWLHSMQVYSNAENEVLNWIKKLSPSKVRYSAGTWTIVGNAATMATAPYKYFTVDLRAYKRMNPDDRRTKQRLWLKESKGTPHVACWFDSDGTPIIYHMDF